jgi:hypothetical protein
MSERSPTTLAAQPGLQGHQSPAAGPVAFCQPVAWVPSPFWLRGEVRKTIGRGFLLALPHWFEPGTALAVELAGRVRQAGVRSVRPRSGGGWLLTCVVDSGSSPEDRIRSKAMGDR